MEFKKLREYLGDVAQVFEVKEYRLMGGKAEGVRAIDISNGAGLELTLLPDRGMDFYRLKYKGQTLNFFTPTGIAAPAYFAEEAGGMGQMFFGGMMLTCGLRNIGLPCRENGAYYGPHGNITAVPAEHVNIHYFEENGAPAVSISAIMRDNGYGTQLLLKRTVTIRYGANEIDLQDRVLNNGFEESPLMVLYHFNMGYPLLCEQSQLILPTRKVTPRTQHAADHADKYLEITPPAAGYEEMCYYHDLETDENGWATAGIYNPQEKLGLKILFDKSTLDHFVQWKMLAKGTFVAGLEPCNATINGMADARENGSLKTIAPGEEKQYRLKVLVFEE